MTNKIARYRAEAGLSQKELAAKCGWGKNGQSRIGHYETSRRTPSVVDAQTILRALQAEGVDCSFEEVFPFVIDTPVECRAS